MKKFLFKMLVFLIVFIDASVGITSYLIVKNMPKSNNTKTSTTNTDTANATTAKTVSLDETYDLNNIQVTEYSEAIGNLEFSYYQIDGLKDESTQISINYALKDDLKNAITKISEENSIEDFYCSPTVYSNFANTISICYYISYSTSNDDYPYINICENFDLKTGNRLSLNDIILNTPKMRQILSNKLYNSVISATSDMDFDENEYIYKINHYNDTEEEIFKLINKFQNNKEINFVFNEKEFYLIDYDFCNILYRDCLNYVTIYDKFNDNNIYDNKYSKLKRNTYTNSKS